MDAAVIEVDERPRSPDAPSRSSSRRAASSPPSACAPCWRALLFVSDKPLTLDQLFEATGHRPRADHQEALDQIAGIHRDGISGVVLHEVAGGWQFRTDPHSAEYVRRFLQVKPQRLTRAALETLAIIAYRQPVTRPEIEDIRGVDCGAVLKALLDRKLIKILGKKDEVGRPMLYGTTREFLEFFALKDLSALPTLREFHELTQEHQEIVEKETARGAECQWHGRGPGGPGLPEEDGEERAAVGSSAREAGGGHERRGRDPAGHRQHPEPTPAALRGRTGAQRPLHGRTKWKSDGNGG